MSTYRKDRHVEITHNVVEESLLRRLLGTIIDCVEAREGETDKSIGIRVFNKRLRDSSRKLDGLVFDLDSSDGDYIRANDSRRPGTITVADLPLRASGRFESCRL
jgi:hypothetical protein